MTECVQIVSYSVMVNGEASENITPCRGLHEGDPLSPFLFLICVEGLFALLQNEERVGRIWGMTVSYVVEPHLMFSLCG